MAEAHYFFEQGQHIQAAERLRVLLEQEAGHPPALALQARNEPGLESACLDALGGLDRVPNLAVSPGELMRLNLTSRAGFMLSRLDGFSSLGDILELSAMPRAEALMILYNLNQSGVVSMD